MKPVDLRVAAVVDGLQCAHLVALMRFDVPREERAFVLGFRQGVEWGRQPATCRELARALRDVLTTYRTDAVEVLVTVERQEAWRAALARFDRENPGGAL